MRLDAQQAGGEVERIDAGELFFPALDPPLFLPRKSLFDLFFVSVCPVFIGPRKILVGLIQVGSGKMPGRKMNREEICRACCTQQRDKRDEFLKLTWPTT